MDFSLVFNDISSWWILLCLVAGTAYAWLLYSKEAHAGKTMRRLLFCFRTMSVALIAFLLLSPLLKSNSRTIEKPIIVLAQDNSSSILLDKKNHSWYNNELPLLLHSLEEKLQGKYDVQSYHFSERTERGISTEYSGKQTDISLLVRELKTRFAGRNLGAVVLLSDGIYNKGKNPLYEMKGLNAPFYTVALGDTIPKKDLLIASVDHNQVVFLENDFRINVNAEALGAAGAGSRLHVEHKGKTVFSAPVNISGNDFRISIPINLTAYEKGRQKYVISLQPVSGEITEKNNTKTIFIEVLDSRQKILLLAAAAHPDLGALKQALESNEQYEVDIRLISKQQGELETDPYSMLILHQLPSAKYNIASLLETIRQERLPVWYIIGNQTELSTLDRSQQMIAISSFNGDYNEVFAVPDPSFYLFTIPGESRNLFNALPPLTAPFCNISPKGQASMLFSQRIGAVETGRPLMLFSTGEGMRTAWLFGEGLWRWRLHNFRLRGNHDATNDLITNTVQYLAAREDTRHFRLNMPKAVFSENETVTFTAELYNKSYQPVTDPEIRILIKDQDNKNFSFIFSKGTNRYHLDAGILPAGEYTYTATVQLGEEESTASGTFVVTPQHAEEMQTTANHQLLFSMAENSGGQMLYPDEATRLYNLLSEKETISPVIYEQERYRELINLKWLFFLLLALLSTEWLLRKRNGLY